MALAEGRLPVLAMSAERMAREGVFLQMTQDAAETEQDAREGAQQEAEEREAQDDGRDL